MATGNEMLARLTYICNEFTNSGAEATRALDHLNAEREQIEAELAMRATDMGAGHPLLRTQTFPTVAAQKRYSLPYDDNDEPDMQKVRRMERIINDAADDYVKIEAVQQLDNKHATVVVDHAPVLINTQTTGPPVGYLLGDDFWQLFPTPDAVYTIRVWYLKRYPDITAADTELNIPDVLIDSIVYGARVRIWDYLHFPTQAAKQELLIKRERAINAVMGRVSDGPRFGNDVIPVEDWA